MCNTLKNSTEKLPFSFEILFEGAFSKKRRENSFSILKITRFLSFAGNFLTEIFQGEVDMISEKNSRSLELIGTPIRAQQMTNTKYQINQLKPAVICLETQNIGGA